MIGGILHRRRTVIMGRLACALPLAATMSCDEEGIEGWRAREIVDRGEVCFGERPPDGGFVDVGPVLASEPVTVWVQAPCVSTSCNRNATGSCEVSRTGSTITVHSRFETERAFGEGFGCTTDCGGAGPDVSCTLEALPAGSYTVVHGEHRWTLEVPSTDPAANRWECPHGGPAGR